ncbi:MAG: hypothetical protein KC912_09100 [Proteobacteria bacterium]|nr:hypothetical protein [Pseudomonadota bacterium]
MIWLLAILSASWAQSESRDYARVTTGLIGEVGHAVEEPALEWYSGARLRLNLGGEEQSWGQFRFAGRAGIRLIDEPGEGMIDRARIRELAVYTEPGPALTFGRFAPEGGGFRLIDGAAATVKFGDGWRVGGFAGEAPDPFSTIPAARFGGGPTLHYDGKNTSFDLLGEVLVAAAGLDRASAVVDVRHDVTDWLRLSSRADLLFGDAAHPVRPADLRAQAQTRLGDARVTAGWRAWSAAALLLTNERDPALTRWARRSTGLEQALEIGALDERVHHQVELSARVPVQVGADAVHNLTFSGSYRPGEVGEQTYGVARVGWTAAGLFGRPLDLTLQQHAYQWGGGPGIYSSAQLVWEPLERLAFDGSIAGGWRGQDGRKEWTPTAYGDLFVDVFGVGHFSFAGGYSFVNGLGRYRWDTNHTLLARVSWRK